MVPPVIPPQTDAQATEPVWLRLSLAGIILEPVLLFGIWLVEVIIFNRARQPGIICLTPAMWLLAAVIGRGVVHFAKSQPAASLPRSAAIAGGVFGVLLGILYMADVLVVGAADPATPGFALWSGGLCILSGAGLCALLSWGVATLAVRRLGLDKDIGGNTR
jgi:hypothetical protein